MCILLYCFLYVFCYYYHCCYCYWCYCCYCCYFCTYICRYCCYCCTYRCMYVVADDGGASVFTSNWPQPHETRVETDETMKLLLASPQQAQNPSE